MNYKLALKFAKITAFIALGLMIAPLIFKVQYILFVVLAVGIYLVGLIIAVIHFRCPHCNSRLNLNIPKTPYCPYCGNKLDWDEK